MSSLYFHLLSSASCGCRELHDLRRWWVVDGGGAVLCRKSIPRILCPLPKLTYTRGFGIKVSNIWLHKHNSHYKNTSPGVPCWLFKQKTFNYEHQGNQNAMPEYFAPGSLPRLKAQLKVFHQHPNCAQFHRYHLGLEARVSSFQLHLCSQDDGEAVG